MRLFDIIIIVLLSILIIFNITILMLNFKDSESGEMVTSVDRFIISGIVLYGKPKLPNYIANSDLIFDQSGWLSDDATAPETPKNIIRQTFGWKSNGFAEMTEKPDSRQGIVILHPISENVPRYIETPEFLLPNSGYIVIGLANAAGKLSYAGREGVEDNIFKVYLVDSNTGLKIELDEITVSSEDGWVDVAYPISSPFIKDFIGRNVKVIVEGWAGGPRNIWWGEWAVIDYIDVVPLR